MYMQSMPCKAFNHTFFLYGSIANKGIHLLSSECLEIALSEEISMWPPVYNFALLTRPFLCIPNAAGTAELGWFCTAVESLCALEEGSAFFCGKQCEDMEKHLII